VTIAWVFFRATSVRNATYVLTHLFSGVPAQLALLARGSADARQLLFVGFGATRFIIALGAVFALLGLERWQRSGSIRLKIAAQPFALRWVAYSAAVLVVATLAAFGQLRFIYFQFCRMPVLRLFLRLVL